MLWEASSPGCRVCGGRLDSFCPVAVQDCTVLPDEAALCSQQEQLHVKSFGPKARSSGLTFQEEVELCSSIEVHGDQIT